MSLDKDAIKESLSLNDVKLILSGLGSSESKLDRKGNPIFQTVCHSGHSHKLYYYEDSQMFHCYTDCSESMDIFELIIRAKKQSGFELTFYEAVKYVAEKTGKRFTTKDKASKNSNLISDWEWISKLNKSKKIDTTLPTYDEVVLDLFLPYPHEHWLNEGISYETQRKYEVSYYVKGERIVLPHRSINSELIGIRGRAMLQEDIDNGKKYMPLTIENKLYNHPTMMNLYGLHMTKEAVSRIKKCVIYEGEKSVLKTEDYYGEDNFSVACCSSQITTFHRDILLSLGVEEVFIAFDKYSEKDSSNEEKIINYQERLIQLAKKFTPYVKTYILWDYDNLLDYSDSPADKGKDVLEALMRNKVEVKT